VSQCNSCQLTKDDDDDDDDEEEGK